jgi:hypothetical protein
LKRNHRRSDPEPGYFLGSNIVNCFFSQKDSFKRCAGKKEVEKKSVFSIPLIEKNIGTPCYD